MIKRLCFPLLLIFCCSLQAEIYQWVDESGKRHFGDKVPERYLEHSEALELQPSNSMPLAENNDSTRATLRQAEQRNQQSALQRNTPAKSKKLSRCEQKNQAYRTTLADQSK